MQDSTARLRSGILGCLSPRFLKAGAPAVNTETLAGSGNIATNRANEPPFSS
jgi:hypothetical protein